MAVGSLIAIANMVDLNLAIRYGIAIRIIRVRTEAVAQLRQTAKPQGTRGNVMYSMGTVYTKLESL